MADVTLEHLTKAYPARKAGSPVLAVDDVSLAVADGEFMVLVGPSGCGKSTTLRLIAGLEEETSGRILIGGAPVNGVLPKDRDIAMVFQNYALYPHMTVAENLGFGLKLRKVPPAEIATRINGASDLLGLNGLLDRRPKELSGGQRQRVAVGRAIVRNPKVFLFDEPLSNLDAQMRVSMRAEISRLHARLGATMVYVTHDQVEAMTMGDRICVMDGGRIMQVADPLTLYNQPANRFVAGFIGTPAMNFFKGTIEHEASGPSFHEAIPPDGRCKTPTLQVLALPVGLVSCTSLPAAGQPVTLGIRPEAIALTPPHASAATATSEALRSSPGEARVELVEQMGAEAFVHLTTGATQFIARVAPEIRPAPGDKVGVTFDLSKAHFFDSATGAAIR